MKELIADITFKVKYSNEDWKEVAVDNYWYRYRTFAFHYYGDCEKLEEIELADGVNILDSILILNSLRVISTAQIVKVLCLRIALIAIRTDLLKMLYC